MSRLTNIEVDPKRFVWQDLASCQGIDPEFFDSKYQKDKVVAKEIDELCLSCPVFLECKMQRIQNKEYGVWAGEFCENGKPDPKRNTHKTPEVIARLEDRWLDGI